MADNGEKHILVVDDDPCIRDAVSLNFKSTRFACTCFENADICLQQLRIRNYDLLVTDVKMPGKSGIELLTEAKRIAPWLPVLVMTAFGTIETAIEAMKQGAYDYLQKPFSTEELILKLDRLMNHKKIVEENQALRKQLGHDKAETKMIGRSTAIRNILSKIHTLASVDSNVLIHGESGTGKECVARLIHESSSRNSGSFIVVSCASLPAELIEAELFGHEPGAFTGANKQRIGRFELANGGTLFLDDVDDISLDLQVKLLRVIQEHKLERIGGEETINVNFRLISAGKKDLALLVEQGKFREDLYFRLNIVPVYLPLLRHRREDIPLLCEYFMNRIALRLNRPEPHIDQEVIAKFMGYTWPGNVRELENIIERMLVLSKDSHIKMDLLPEEFFESDTSAVTIQTDYLDQIDLHKTIADLEGQLVRWALAKTDGNLAKAASLLNIPRSSLQYKISKFNHEQQRT